MTRPAPRHLASHFASRTLLLLVVLAATLVTAGTASAQVIVCLSGPNCQSFPDPGSGDQEFTHLQAAFNHITSSSYNATPAFLYLEPGLHTSASSPTWQQMATAVWRPTCGLRAGFTGFRLTGRAAPTTIQGTGTQPSAVQIWAKVPDHMLTSPIEYWAGGTPYYKIFHGLGLLQNQHVTIANLSIVSDGGFTENGAGDATIYARETDLTVVDSLVLGNKGASNCLREYVGSTFVAGTIFDDHPVFLDQEGIVIDDAALTLSRTVVGGNLHVGVMALRDATALVSQSLVRGNGWDKNHFQATQKGVGVTSFHHSVDAACFDGNTQIDVDRSSVIANNGYGVLLRGEFDNLEQSVVDSDLRSNSRNGLALTNGWDPGLTTVENTSAIDALGNLYDDNILIEDVSIDSSSLITVDHAYTTINVSGTSRIRRVTEPTGSPWSSAARWNQLLQVGAAVGGETRDCPDI